MLNMNNEEALAVIFANSYDALIPEMVSERLMASIPFAGRYRLCDFLISSMVHSGIDNISLIVKKNYHSLMDHLGSGQEFDLARKNGGINIVPPYAQKQIKVYEGRVEAIESLKGYLRKCTQKYVIMADANYVFNFDFRELIEAHKNTGADITAMYRKQEVPKVFLRPNGNNDEMYYTFDIDDGRIKKIYINDRDMGKVNFGMNIYIMEKEKLIRIVDDAFVHGYSYFTRDLMATNTDSLNIQAYEYTGYASQITDMKSYFEENMKLLDEDNRAALFKSGNSIYTKIRDDNPTRYINGSKAKNVMVADGCVIEGTVENSILSRGVKIGKNAKVKNCILLQDTVIEDGANLEYVITDKNVRVSSNRSLTGEIKVADEVVAIIAGLAATEVEGVSSMAGNITNEIVSRLGMKNLSKGIQIEIADNEVVVDVALNIAYGYSIPEVSTKVQEKVKSAIETMTGLSVATINVRIASVDMGEN